MAGIRIVTDSTADIPDELRLAAGIEVVPLSVIFGEESLLDKVEIGPEEFVRRLKTSKVLPTTAQRVDRPLRGRISSPDRRGRGDDHLAPHLRAPERHRRGRAPSPPRRWPIGSKSR